MATNTGLPTGDQQMPDVWLRFRETVRTAPALDVARLVGSGCRTVLPPAVLAALRPAVSGRDLQGWSEGHAGSRPDHSR